MVPNRVTSTASSRRAIVIGGSMAGLFAATLLRKAGWHTEVFERSKVELRGRGAGIVTHPDLIQALERSGAQLNDLGVTVYERVALNSKGEAIYRLPYEQIVTSWDRLHQIMRATISPGAHHLGYNLKIVEQNADSVTAIFENGERVTGDLLVGADGFRSVVRNIFAPEIQPTYAGYVVWRGVADEGLIPKEAHAAVFEKFAFFLPPHNKNIGYPIAGSDNDLRPGYRRWNWVWYRPADRAALDDMLIDEDRAYHAVSIPPPKVRAGLITQLKEDAGHFLPPPMRDILSCISRPFFTPIYDLLVERMVYGRVVMIGDAAAVARPHVGMGASKAGTDAETLADSLAGGSDLVEGLVRFERERLPIAGKAVARGRSLGDYMVDHVLPEGGIDDPHWHEFHTVAGILKHTASSAFLRSSW
jgi:2-polyprenyl-6-methoxyphenol hydroxylase-like FAD-dependent oxidoreductase